MSVKLSAFARRRATISGALTSVGVSPCFAGTAIRSRLERSAVDEDWREGIGFGGEASDEDAHRPTLGRGIAAG